MIIRTNIVGIVLVFALILPTQSQELDSLKSLLKGATGQNRIDILYDLSYGLIEVDNRAAIRYALEGYNASIELNDSLRIVRMGLVAASALRRLQKIDSSIQIYHPILSIAEKKKYLTELSVLLNSMGIAYSQKAQYDKALGCYYRALEMRLSGQDTLSQVVVLNNIGGVYYKLKNYRKALDIFLNCKRMQAAETGMDHGLLMINIASCYAYLGSFKEALSYIEKGVSACTDACDPQITISANFAKALVYFGKGDHEGAERFFLQSYNSAKVSGDVRLQLDNIDYLSQICLMQNRVASALSFLHGAELLINQNSSFGLERIKIYHRFSQVYRHINDFESASKYQLKYSELRDGLYNEEMTMNLMQMEAEYQERDNKARISAQDELIAFKDAAINHEKNLNKVTGLLIIVSVGFIILLFRNYRQKRNLSVLLDAKIRARTLELEESKNQLLSAVKERDLILSRAQNDMSETISTIHGLCSNGLMEVSEPVAHVYIKRIAESNNRLVSYLRSTVLRSVSATSI